MSKALKPIGFDRMVRLDWLDATAGWAAEGLSPREIRHRLDEFLAGKLAGTGPHSARGKTETVLLHIWVLAPDLLIPLRDDGLSLYRQLPGPERLAIHWGMCLATYPFFREVTATTGRLLNVQGHVSMAQIVRRVVESWGDRSTLPRAVARVVRSFVDWGVLKDTGERGVLAAQEKIDLRRYKDLQAWMLEALLMGSGRDMISVRGLIGNAALFPFSLRVSTRDLEKRRRLEVLRQGPDDDVVRVLRDGLPRGGPRTS